MGSVCSSSSSIHPSSSSPPPLFISPDDSPRILASFVYKNPELEHAHIGTPNVNELTWTPHPHLPYSWLAQCPITHTFLWLLSQPSTRSSFFSPWISLISTTQRAWRWNVLSGVLYTHHRPRDERTTSTNVIAIRPDERWSISSNYWHRVRVHPSHEYVLLQEDMQNLDIKDGRCAALVAYDSSSQEEAAKQLSVHPRQLAPDEYWTFRACVATKDDLTPRSEVTEVTEVPLRGTSSSFPSTPGHASSLQVPGL